MNIIQRTWKWLSNIGVDQGMSPIDEMRVRVLNQVAMVIFIGANMHLARSIVNEYPTPHLNFALPLFPLLVFVFHYFKKHMVPRVLIFTFFPFLLFFFDYLFGEKLKIDYAFFALILGILIVFDKKSIKIAAILHLALLYAASLYCTRTFESPHENYITIVDTLIVVIETTFSIAIFMTSAFNELERQKDVQISLNQNLNQRNLELEDVISQNKVKDKLFALVAHDLRSPLISLGGLAKKVNFLLHRNRPEEVLQLGDTIETAVTAAHKLLDNLLNWAMVKGGQFPNHLQPSPVRQQLDEVVELYQNIAKAKHLLIRTEYDAPNPTAWCDPMALGTILRNLVDNAIKFSIAGGEVAIGCRTAEGKVFISVKDTGIGMTEAQLASLFALTGNKGTEGTSQERGTGLGLVLCHELATMNEGTINVQSKVGEGSVFELELPASSNAAGQ
jgi:signal transduction histidine kinase